MPASRGLPKPRSRSAVAAAIRALSDWPFSQTSTNVSKAVHVYSRANCDSLDFMSTVARLGLPAGRPAPSRVPPLEVMFDFRLIFPGAMHSPGLSLKWSCFSRQVCGSAKMHPGSGCFNTQTILAGLRYSLCHWYPFHARDGPSSFCKRAFNLLNYIASRICCAIFPAIPPFTSMVDTR